MAPDADPTLPQAMATAIDPTKGKGWDRVGPLIITAATAVIAVACALGFVPGADLATGLGLIFGVAAGANVRHHA
jgi:hypothetical protein